MALTSTLGSPGIEIREIDNSIRIDSSTATTVFVPGFAAQGPVEEVISIGSTGDFELIYGKPTNGAERYFYYTVKALLDKGGSGVRVLTSRLPYGAGAGDGVSDAYTLLAYPAVPVIKKNYGTVAKPILFDTDRFVITKDGEISGLSDDIFNLTNDIKPIVSESSYQIHIEEDWLSSKGLDMETLAPSFVFTHGENKLPLTTATSSIAPTLKVTISDAEDAPSVITGEETLGTEISKGKLYVHLSYALYDKDLDENKVSPIGHVVFKMVYSTNLEKGLVAEHLANFSIEDTTIYTKFVTAFEIAKTYDGQSKDDTSNNPANYSKDVTYIIGAPATFQVSLKDYYNIITGDFINWSRNPYNFSGTDVTDEEDETSTQFGLLDALGHSAFIAINTSRTSINENFEGFYIGMTDNMFSTPSSDYVFNAVTGVKVTTDTYLSKNQDKEDGERLGLIDSVDTTVGDFSTLGQQRLTFKLDSNNQGSISRVMSRNITNKDISSTDFDDTMSLGLFKLSKTTDSNDVLKLNYSIREKYNWSFSRTRLKSDANSTKPVSYYVNNIMDGSNNITIMMNPYISDKDFLSSDGQFHGKMRVFGDKLVSTLDFYENKYIRRKYIANTNQSVNNTLTTPAKLITNNLTSYTEIIKQAGISPYVLRTNFASNITETPKDEYKCFTPMNSIYPFGVYTASTNSQKIIGQVPTKLKRALELVENDEEYPDIDLILEGGLGTIYMNSNGNDFTGDYASRTLVGTEPENEDDINERVFDETVILTGVEDMRTSRASLSEDAQDVIEDYLAVSNVFLQFADSMQNGGRGDTFFISDVPRGVLIKGKDTKVTSLYGVEIENSAYDFGESVVHSFPTSIYYPIKHQFDNVVSTYASVYAQWVKIFDDFSGDKVWIPISGHIAALMASTDAVYGPWYASAGLRRGVISGVLDYALSPTISQRTDLYKICINSVPKIPNYGVTVWGIRTMSKKDSAFDQNTCRRTFLYMEKKIKQLLRYYIFEPNTSYTRLQIFNDIDPFLEGIKNKGGIYSYTLVTDTTVNTPEIINNGDLVVAIAAAPTRTAENIIVEFTANKYSEEVSAAETLA